MTTKSSNIATSYWTYKNQINIPSEGNSNENKTKSSVNNLILNIKSILNNKENQLDADFFQLFDDTLSLRYDSLKLLSEKNITFEDLIDTVYETFEDRDIPSDFETLNENVLFSIRTTTKIARNMFNDKNEHNASKLFENLTTSNFSNNNLQKPYSNLVQSIKLVSKQFPNDSLLNLMKLINSSLYTELGIITADILFDNYDSITFQKKRIDELSELIVIKSQEYGSLAMELGLVGKIRSLKSLRSTM